MIVVSDPSPLRYLAMIGGLDWLPELFGEVICPPEVIEECRHAGAPRKSVSPSRLGVLSEAGVSPFPTRV